MTQIQQRSKSKLVSEADLLNSCTFENVFSYYRESGYFSWGPQGTNAKRAGSLEENVFISKKDCHFDII